MDRRSAGSRDTLAPGNEKADVLAGDTRLRSRPGPLSPHSVQISKRFRKAREA